MTEDNKWIVIETRSLTHSEREAYGDECSYIYDCALPRDGQEVLITTNRGLVCATTFYNDDSAYFEYFEDEGEVVAWMPFPEPYPYKKERKSNELL